MGFNELPQIAQEWTNDARLIARGIAALHPGGATAIYDALGLACRKLSARERRLERRVIILISDGDDNRSRESIKAVSAQALAAEAAVYVLMTERADKWRTAEPSEQVRRLEQLAELTGGRALKARRETDLPRAFASIQQELRTQYMLAYKPADFQADGRCRAIDLRSQGRLGLHLHYRHGYYSRREKTYSASSAK
jgi:VWFA-related protein